MADAAKTEVLFRHPYATNVMAGWLGATLQSAEVEKARLLLAHPNAEGITVDYLSVALYEADAAKAKLLLVHPNAVHIPASILGAALQNADAAKVALLLTHHNAAGIRNDHLGIGLVNLIEKMTPALMQRITDHPNYSAIPAECIQQALDKIYPDILLDKMIPGHRAASDAPLSRNMALKLMHHPNYQAELQGTTSPASAVSSVTNHAPGVNDRGAARGGGMIAGG
jgi:hypothetical protein